MGSFSNRMQQLAYRLLNTYGQIVNVTRKNVAGYNAMTGDVSENADTTYSGNAHPSNYASADIDNIVILQTDIRLLFYSTTEPLVNDIFDIDSALYTARDVTKYKAQGDKIYYVVQLRQ